MRQCVSLFPHENRKGEEDPLSKNCTETHRGEGLTSTVNLLINYRLYLRKCRDPSLGEIETFWAEAIPSPAPFHAFSVEKPVSRHTAPT